MPATAPRLKKSVPGSEADLAAPEAAGNPISTAGFGRFQRLIQQETGIWLAEHKMALLCGRLARRLRSLSLATLDQYYELVTRPDQDEERRLMVDAITTNETRFFRDSRHFEFLEQHAIPRWQAEAQRGQRPRRLRVWSAGCSSGEEPYSLAMVLARRLPAEQGWNTPILATDISTRMLEQAGSGIYSIAKSADIPESLLKTYMLKGIDAHQGEMKVTPEIAAMVDFERLNLTQGPYPPEKHFDLIFCRNVLIYFALPFKQQVARQLAGCLAGGGVLFLGQAENLSGMDVALRSVAPAVYVHAGEQSGF